MEWIRTVDVNNAQISSGEHVAAVAVLNWIATLNCVEQG